MQAAQAALLSGNRLHLHHGPIDLVIKAWGEDQQIAYQRATKRFSTVLDELVAELPYLRAAEPDPQAISSPVGKRMVRAISLFQSEFVTPMAAVAGAVADEISFVMQNQLNLEKFYVNNGGDISVYLAKGQSLTTAIHAHNTAGQVVLHANQAARGVATSGWRGRSHSFGIADAVTVLAKTAAQADVAATLIANAVNLPRHPAIKRRPANALSPDSDLKSHLVTTDVGYLNCHETDTALTAGSAVAQKMFHAGTIQSAALFLNKQTRIVGKLPPPNTINEAQDDHLQIA